MKNRDLTKLLENTCTAMYWLGFLLADGSFPKNRIMLKLNNQDKACSRYESRASV